MFILNKLYGPRGEPIKTQRSTERSTGRSMGGPHGPREKPIKIQRSTERPTGRSRGPWEPISPCVLFSSTINQPGQYDCPRGILVFLACRKIRPLASEFGEFVSAVNLSMAHASGNHSNMYRPKRDYFQEFQRFPRFKHKPCPGRMRNWLQSRGPCGPPVDRPVDRSVDRCILIGFVPWTVILKNKINFNF